MPVYAGFGSLFVQCEFCLFTPVLRFTPRDDFGPRLVLSDCTGRLHHIDEGLEVVSSQSLAGLGVYISPYPVAFSKDAGLQLLSLRRLSFLSAVQAPKKQ